MCTVILSVALFVFGLAFQGGNAAPECAPPPKNLLIYFDIEQISLMSLQSDFTGLFQSPLMCRTGSDKDCEAQKCCGTEEGCCLTDSTSNYGKCGCRDKGQSKCSYPAPLAVLGKTRCDSGDKTTHVTCLRERRGEQPNIVGKNSTRQSVVEAKRNVHELKRTQRQEGEPDYLDIDIHPDPVDVQCHGHDKNIFPPHFTVEQLAETLNETMIDQFFQYVAERKSKGESYGLPG